MRFLLRPRYVLINKSAFGTRSVIFRTSLSEKEINLSLQFSRSDSHLIAFSKSRPSMQSYRSCSLLSDSLSVLLQCVHNLLFFLYCSMSQLHRHMDNSHPPPTFDRFSCTAEFIWTGLPTFGFCCNITCSNGRALFCFPFLHIVAVQTFFSGVVYVNVHLYYRRGSSIASTAATATIARPPLIHSLERFLDHFGKSVRL